jgi:hypothetical protein
LRCRSVELDEFALAARLLGFGQRRRVSVELLGLGAQRGVLVVQVLLALAELGFQLRLGLLGRLGFAQHALAVDVADLQFLSLGRDRDGGRTGQQQGEKQFHGTGFHQNAVPTWNWNRWILSLGRARTGKP